MLTPERIAERAYSAFCNAQGNKDSNGQRCPVWEALPITERSAWVGAIHETVKALNSSEHRGVAHGQNAQVIGGRETSGYVLLPPDTRAQTDPTAAPDTGEHMDTNRSRPPAAATRQDAKDEQDSKNDRAKSAHAR
jgi:hypothetical protein